MKKKYAFISKKYNVKKKGPKLFSTELTTSSKTGRNTLHVVLAWYNFGFCDHEIYIENGRYRWTDEEEPLFTLGFDSIDEMMEEFKLPKSLRVELEKL
jgi:hypothetical protein